MRPTSILSFRITFRKQISTLLFSVFALFSFYFTTTSAKAQTATVLPQQRLSRWHIPPGNYSGIASIGEERFAVVSDKASRPGFYIFTIRQDSITGAVTEVKQETFLPHNSLALTCYTTAPDFEGIAFNNLTSRLWITDEATQRIRETTTDGTATGRELHIPTAYSTTAIYPNLGFEALTFDADHQLLWTTTEEPTQNEASLSLKSLQEKKRQVSLLAFDSTAQLKYKLLYCIDERGKKNRSRVFLNGIPALCAMPNGKLLVMERELYMPRYILGGYCEIRIYEVNPQLDFSATSITAPLPKTLIARWHTHIRLIGFNLANYEGMCLGRRLSNGHQTVLCISDAQGGAGKAFYRLHDYIRVIILP